MRESPTVFVSYSWDDDQHRAWIRAFATRLRVDGVRVILDQWHLVPGDQVPHFMERSVRTHDYVLIVCTPRYKTRSDDREGGVGYEGDIMTAEVLTGRNQQKFIPVLRGMSWHDSALSWLKGKYFIDLRGEPYNAIRYQELLLTLHNRREQPPPVGDAKLFAASIREFDPQSSVQLLINVLGGGSTAERREAAAVIRTLGVEGRSAAPPLSELLQYPDEFVVVEATLTLGHLGSSATGAIPSIVANLTHESAAVRKASSAALDLVDPKMTLRIAPLISALSSPASRNSAVGELVRVGAGCVTHLLRVAGTADEATRQGIRETLAQIGAAALDYLISALAEPDTLVREVVLAALGDLEPAAVADLQVLREALLAAPAKQSLPPPVGYRLYYGEDGGGTLFCPDLDVLARLGPRAAPAIPAIIALARASKWEIQNMDINTKVSAVLYTLRPFVRGLLLVLKKHGDPEVREDTASALF